MVSLTCTTVQSQERFGNLGNQSSGEDSGFRIRVVWGGEQARIWRGRFVLGDGRFENPAALGLEPDAGAALHLSGNELRLHAMRPSAFNGVDLTIVDSTSQSLTLEMTRVGAAGQMLSRTVDLSPLFSGTGTSSIQLDLDDQGSRIDISRAPGDRLPIEFSRDHLIFEPGEIFEFSVKSFVAMNGVDGNARVSVDLLSSSESRVLNSSQYDLQRDGGTWSRTSPISIAMPDEEGVYDIQLKVHSDSLASRLSFNRQHVSRTIQVVVVDSESGNQDHDDQVVLWQKVYDSDENRGQWLERLPGVPQFRQASSVSSDSNSGVSSRQIDGKTWTEFAPGGWQAVSLQVNELDLPHIVEIEYIDDGPMALGISVLQPDAGGQVPPFDVDSGISIPESGSNGEAMVRRHRIFFWPRHDRPYLLFANRHKDRPATIGKIRVLAGPDRLASSEFPPPEGESGIRGLASRQYLAFYEKPLFPENFSINKAVDRETGQPVHDWHSFLSGADRWTQYLKANGYTGAMLLVAGDGSALYPSQLLQPTPRFDSGIFSSSGMDPVRKDVVELLLRMFEREGLLLVPVFHFNSPLPALEQQRIAGAGNSADDPGILLVDLQGQVRTGILERANSPVSIYNPLDKRVQTAYDDVIQEFSERYATHQSLGGIGLLYSRDALQVMPGQTWGVDATTLARFATDVGIPAESMDTGKQWLVDLLASDRRQEWLNWRQSQMGLWLERTRLRTSSLGSASRLFLLGSDMLQTQDAFSALAPSLRRTSDMNDALARIAFPVNTVSANKDLYFLQPFEVAPEKSLANDRLNVQLDYSGSGRQLLRDIGDGVLFSHRYSWAEFDQLGRKKLFGPAQTQPLMRLQPLSPAAHWNRERLASGVVHSDGQFLVDGGWLTSFGQEEHLTGFIETWTRLPAIAFADVTLDEESQPQTGVVVRQAVNNQRNYFYAVNPTPWKLRTTIHFTSPNSLLESIGPGEFLFDDQSSRPQTVFEIEPFSIRAGYTDQAVTIAGYHVELPEEAASDLQSRLNALLTKVSRAAQTEPVNVLINPGFETPSQNGDEGWYYDNRLSDLISLSHENPFAGQSALTLVSSGTPTWIRSNEFDAPATGRLSVSVMIRTDRPQTQPPLRISIQGSDGRQDYYRYGVVGGQARQVSAEWQEFAVHFDDLPLNEQGKLQIGFDLMGTGQVDIDQVRIFDRWLDQQDSRALTQLLALAGFQLSSRQNLDRCRQILNSYWPRFLEEYFPDEPLDDIAADGTSSNRPPRTSQSPDNSSETGLPRR